MCSGKWELGLIMIKGCWFPSTCRMAQGAIVTEVVLDVIWISYTVKVVFVTREAIGWRAGIAISMTIYTLQREVSPGERELGLVVIKGGRFPSTG